MGHVFISYSRQNIDKMRRINGALRTAGFFTWTDEKLIPGTPDWQTAIEKALENADALVAIFTPEAKQSRWVREELNYAEAYDVRIFPLLAAGSKATSVPFGFITAQWVDITQEESHEIGMRELIASLRIHLGLENVGGEEKTERPKAEFPAPDIAPEEPAVEPPVEPPPDVRAAVATVQAENAEVTRAAAVLRNAENRWWRRADAATRLGEIATQQALDILNEFYDASDLDVQIAVRKALDRIRGVTSPGAAEAAAIQPGVQTQLTAVRAVLPSWLTDVPELQLDEIPDWLTEPPESAPKATTPPPAQSKTYSGGMQTVKLVVTGPYGAGKTTFIQTASEIDVISTSGSLGLSVAIMQRAA